MSRRTERIAEELKSEIARVLREDVSDSRVQLVTLTRVDVAPDLTSALVFWSALGSEEVDTIQDGLDSAAPFVRRQLARADAEIALEMPVEQADDHEAEQRERAEHPVLLRYDCENEIVVRRSLFELPGVLHCFDYLPLFATEVTLVSMCQGSG